MNRKCVVASVVLSSWALLVLTYTRPWPSPDSLTAALAIIIVGLSLWAAVFSPVAYLIGALLHRRGRQKA